jgi:predicted HAD superfamily Cof-like phosphohydrolase
MNKDKAIDRYQRMKRAFESRSTLMLDSDVALDMETMHSYYEVYDALETLDKSKLLEFLKFRFRFLQEELDEGQRAIEQGNAEEVVDSLIDLVVVAVGTLDLFGVDFNRAWYEVWRANMNKEVGIKEGRPNPFGLPDLVKPEGWTAPSHANNHGALKNLFTKD